MKYAFFNKWIYIRDLLTNTIFRPTLACLRTVQCDYALTITFVPGDRHLIVGLKNGKMLIIDIASGDILEEVSAHSKELWSVTLFPDLVIFLKKNILTIATLL